MIFMLRQFQRFLSIKLHLAPQPLTLA